MIFLDPTEAGNHSRLPASFISNCKIIAGLEELTGADMLVTREDVVVESVTTTLARMKLKTHLRDGLLIQRKSGRDLTASLDKLPEIFLRMSQHNDRPILLFCGSLEKQARGDKAVIDGHDTGYYYNAVLGAIFSWQYLWGGSFFQIKNDEEIARWLNIALNALQSPPTRTVARRRIQSLYALPPAVDWLSQARVGIGEDKSLALMEYFGSLEHCIGWFTQEQYSEIPVGGIGEKTWQKMKKLLTTNECYEGEP